MSATASPPASGGGHSRNGSAQEQLRAQVTELLGSARLKALRELRVGYTFLDAAVIYLLLGAVLAATAALHAAYGPWITLSAAPALAFVAGVAFNWINVQIHEASHNLLLPDKKRNDLFCNLALGALALQDVQTYRATHGMHHSYLHTERDPDLWVYASRVGGMRQLSLGVFEDLSLLTILRRRRQVAAFLLSHGRRREALPRYIAPAKLVAQGAVLAALTAACGAWGVVYYAAIYLYGLMAVFPALVRVRTVVQHYDPSSARDQPGAALTGFTSRTTVASFWQFLVLGARMDYHFEHHLFQNVPYYNLRKMHEALQRAALFETITASTGQQLRTEDYLLSFLRLAS